MVQDEQLSFVNVTSPLGLVNIGPPAGVEYNAIGYNIIDGFIYGYDRDNDEIVRVDETGAVTGLGLPPSLPALGYYVGDVDPLGFMFLQAPFGAVMYRVDLNDLGAAAVEIDLVPNTNLYDFAYNPRTGFIYGVHSGSLRVIDPDTGVVTSMPVTGDTGVGSGINGAVWFDPFGNLFAYRNSPGQVYRVNTSTGESVLLGAAPTVGLNDGTRCSVHLGFLKDVAPVVASPGETVTFTYLIVNPADPVSPNVTINFDDTLPPEVNVIPGSLTISGSASTPTSTVTGNDVSIDGLELEPQAEVTITIQAVVRADAPPGLVPSQATLSNVPPSAGGPTVLSHPTNAVVPEPTIFEVLDDRDADGVLNPDDPDDDNDGILDEDEGVATELDTDLDGVPNHFDLDSDNDGIPDLVENAGAMDADALDADRDGLPDDATDTDGDGVVDVFDADPDDPGVTMSNLPVRQTDADSLADAYDLDADGDGIYDIVEADGPDTDADGVVDDFTDAEGNGFATTVDPAEDGTPWPTPDTDTDGAFDFQDIDSDDDQVPDATEGHDVDADGAPDVAPTGADIDGNGVDDAYDTNGTPAPTPDHDSDLTPDYRDTDDDGDSIPTYDGTEDDEDVNGDGDPTNDDTNQNGTPNYLENPLASGGVAGGSLGCGLTVHDARRVDAPWALVLFALVFCYRLRR